MDPPAHYSQRDPLYTNAVSLPADGDDLQTAADSNNNHVSEHHHGSPKYVYVKEPEPIIEIIIKESNATLPPLPSPPPPPAKKREQVQVFYVKYRKNPHGRGKDSIVYDKPVPALSPVVPDDDGDAEQSVHPSPEYATHAPLPPPPSTTLRTIIKPDSETYHSPSGIKVTFGKEGWEHGKRSSEAQPQQPQPQARQFPGRRQPISSYRPDRFPYQFRPPFKPPTQPQFRFPTEHFKLPPPPPQFAPQEFQFPRQPVPYKPFEYLRPQSVPVFPPPQQFHLPERFVPQKPNIDVFGPKPQQNHPQTETPFKVHQQQGFPPQHQQQFPEFRFPSGQFRPDGFPQSPQQEIFPQQQPHQVGHQVQQQQHQVGHQVQQHLPSSAIPPGGELIQSLPRYEQHIVQTQTQTAAPPPRQHVPKQSTTTERPQPPPQQYFVQSVPSIQTDNRQSHHQVHQHQAPPEQRYQSFHQSSTTTPTPTTTAASTTTAAPTRAPEANRDLVAQLPDEVPEELRQQLLSSGILSNAQISVLDYDKVGDIPISALPPDQLANFYNAGGAQQIAGSEPAPTYAQLSTEAQDQETEASEVVEETRAPVEMKVVRYDPETERGQRIQESYVDEAATRTQPVVVDDRTYNRYLPLKIGGSEFPIPDVPELRGRNITSVVVLAPVTAGFKEGRVTRDAPEDLEFVSDRLKRLLKEPTRENYLKFLDKENGTASDKQSIVLLVSGEGPSREIFMYDIANRSVNKLSGELSTAFVDAAEQNSSSEEKPDQTPSPSEVVETRVPFEGILEGDNLVADDDLSASASDYAESRVPIIDPYDGDLKLEASQQLERFVDVSGMPVESQGDLTPSSSNNEVASAT